MTDKRIIDAKYIKGMDLIDDLGRESKTEMSSKILNVFFQEIEQLLKVLLISTEGESLKNLLGYFLNRISGLALRITDSSDLSSVKEKVNMLFGDQTKGDCKWKDIMAEEREYVLAEIITRASLFLKKLSLWEEFSNSLPNNNKLKDVAAIFYLHRDRLLKKS